MEVWESILDSIDEELSFEDVEMMEVEGEVFNGHTSGETNTTHIYHKQDDINSHCANNNTKLTSNMAKKKKNRKKRKNKKNKIMPSSDAVNIDKFVLSVCKRLREPKSYLLYSAVGVLGVSALKDLLKEVDAVQACGGQKTALGDRFRTGGGILWNILKTRDPNAYKEIMKKGRDFEKQFRRPLSSARPPGASGSNKEPMASTSDDFQSNPPEEQSVETVVGEKRGSVLDRIRVPVSYDDLPGEPPEQSC